MNKGHLLLFCMAIAFCLNPLYAQTYSGGTGTESDPFLISQASDLTALASAVNGGNTYQGKFFKVTSDIDLSGMNFTPIAATGSTTTTFMGTFDGNGKTISNLTFLNTAAYSYSYFGLFGRISGATIKNLKLSNCSVTANGKTDVGGLCGSAVAYSSINNVSVQGNVRGQSLVGLVCGSISTSTIEGCVSSGKVESSNTYSAFYVGGICGEARSSSTIKKCCNLASVTAKNAGGICGSLSEGNSYSNLYDCSNSGIVTGNSAGGIVGRANNRSRISKCLNAGQCAQKVMPVVGSVDISGGPLNQYSYLYVDSQIFTNSIAGYGNPQGKTTDILTSGSFFNDENWSEAPGRYPIPAGLENNPIAQLAAASATMSVNDNVTTVKGPIMLSQVSGETWAITSGSSLQMVDGCMAYPKLASGKTTLTVSLASGGITYTKALSFTAKAIYTPSQVSSGQWTPVGNDNAIIAGTVDLGDGLSQSQYTVQNLHISNGGEFTINPATTLIVNGILSCNDVNKLILEDGAQLIHNNNGVKATLKKDIEGYGGDDATDGWYFVSAPVFENPNVSSIMPQEGNFDLYRFNEAESLWENVKDQSNDFSTLNNGEGFLYANSEGEDISFAGTLMASHAEIPLTNEGSGWNLVGNPFPCDAMVNKPYYVCNGSSVVLSTDNIAPGMGVMVQAEGDDDFVSFTKVLPDQQSSQVVPSILAEVRLATRGASLMDNARIGLGESNQLEKFHFNENSCLYIPQNNKEYAVVNASNQGTLPLCFKAPTNGDYTIHFCINNTEMDYLHLIDNLTGVEVDLLMLDNYTFSAKTTDYASRFKLVFKAKPENEIESSEFAFFSDGNLVIMNEGNATLQIIDMAGRIVKSQTIDGDFRMGTQDLNHGVYVLNLEGKSQKIVL